jgi:lysophospholipase L1-like esterase
VLPRCVVFPLLLFAFGPGAPAAAPRTLHRLEGGKPVRIVCFGDSVTGIYYHTGGRRAWSDLLGLALQGQFPSARIEVLNAGISGQSTLDALARLDVDVLAPKPDVVILMFGLNDVARVPAETYRANLRELARRIRARDIELVFMTPNAVEAGDPARPPERVSDFAGIMHEVGRELDVPVADAHQVFLAARASHPAEAFRLMSDSIHPNLRGHVLFAETAAEAIAGRPVPVGELPVLQPRLPNVSARLRAGIPVNVVAMKPFDTLVGPALRRHFPQAEIRVTAWDPAGKSLAELEDAAKDIGWWKFRTQPDAPRPDLVIVAVPPDATAAAGKFYRSYTWVLNWSQDMGKPDRWDCLAVLPSVAHARLSVAERANEALARSAVLDIDLPLIARRDGDEADAAELFARELDALLDAGPP